MPNQLGKNRHRTVFICDTPDYEDFVGYAEDMGFTVSVLLREAVYRLAKEIRENKKIVLLRQPRDDEGHPTTERRRRAKKTKTPKEAPNNEPTATQDSTPNNEPTPTQDSEPKNE
jgi:hypothetical protein